MPRGTDQRPRHEQVAAELREQILSGDLAPGAQLPSTAQLMARFDAAKICGVRRRPSSAPLVDTGHSSRTDAR
ncbi:GntR family transcriptional regulator [Myceligenerans halotolerans]